MSAVNCMGGWCTLRDVCRHHVTERSLIVERLCEPQSLDAFSPVVSVAFVARVNAPQRANSVFDLARAQGFA